MKRTENIIINNNDNLTDLNNDNNSNSNSNDNSNSNINSNGNNRSNSHIFGRNLIDLLEKAQEDILTFYLVTINDLARFLHFHCFLSAKKSDDSVFSVGSENNCWHKGISFAISWGIRL